MKNIRAFSNSVASRARNHIVAVPSPVTRAIGSIFSFTL